MKWDEAKAALEGGDERLFMKLPSEDGVTGVMWEDRISLAAGGGQIETSLANPQIHRLFQEFNAQDGWKPTT